MPYNLYCTKADLIAEGFDTSAVDPYWPNRIQAASEFIEQVCGRWFGAIERGGTSGNDPLRVDSSDRRVLQVEIPIVQIDSIQIVYEPFHTTDVTLDTDGIRVYNRHLTQGLVEPDDREAPRLEIESFTGYPGTYLSYWPEGSQNIELTGWFGYTELLPTDDAAEDPAGSQLPKNKGSIPVEINRVAMELCGRSQATIASKYGAGALNPATLAQQWPVTEMKTRDQSIKFAVGGSSSGGGSRFSSITGDPDIDMILMKYRRPARIGMLGDTRGSGYGSAWTL